MKKRYLVKTIEGIEMYIDFDIDDSWSARQVFDKLATTVGDELQLMGKSREGKFSFYVL